MGHQERPGFLTGGGEVGALIRSHDWSASPLGDPSTWPQSLRSVVGLLLGSKFPMFVAWGEELGFLYNDPYAEVLGAKHPAALGARFHDIWAEIWPDISPLIDAAMAGEAVYRDNLPLVVNRRGFDEQAWFTFSYSPVRDESGRVAGMFCAVAETTAQVLAERRQAFRLALEEQLRGFADPRDVTGAATAALGRHFGAVRVGYAEVEPGGSHCRIEGDWCAEGALSITGRHRLSDYGPAFMAEYEAGRTVAVDDFATDPRSAGTSAIAAHAEYGIQAQAVVPLNKAGRLAVLLFVHMAAPHRWAEADLLLIADVAERTWAALERARAEGALRDSEARLHLALEAGRIGTWLLDIGADSAERSPLHDAIFGYTESLPHWSFERFISHVAPEDRTVVEERFTTALSTASEWRFECRIDRADGVRRWIEARATPVMDGSGAVAGFTGVVLDIDDRREAETRLRTLAASLELQVEERTAALVKSQEALAQSQKMEAVGQLTGGLAHDFNNLLAGISGSLELLQARVAQGRIGDLERYLAAAQGAAKRAAALTHRLLAFTRRQTLDPKPTDVNRLVASMEDLIRRTVGPEVTVEVVAAGGLWATLVDPNQLENALLNLCINARDAMPGGGRLTIETGNRWLDERGARGRDLLPGQYVSLCVSDTGTGMAPEVVRRAFDPFFTTKPIGMGTGLGLSMVYGFVRQSGGQVCIYSEPGQGTMVCLYLPRHHGEADEADGPSELTEAPRAGQGETVLVVDDEPTVRMLVTEVLGDLGYTAIEAADGPAGLRVLQSDVRIDLLVTDVGLPGGMNGRQVADAARERRPGLRVLFITGYAENAVLSHGHLDPGMHVMTKPFAMNDLASRIKELIVGTWQ